MVLLQVRRVAERLTTPFDPDAYLSTLHPLWGTRARGVIERISPIGEHAASVRIRPGRAWAGHRPGQFVTLGVDVRGVRHHRAFTLTSAPGDPTLEVTVQARPDGVVSSHLVDHARAGDVVQLGAAAGDFAALDERPTPPLLFITGGSGVTPAIGILRALDAEQRCIDAVVLHHSVSPSRAWFTDELDELAARHPQLRVLHVHDRPDGSHLLDAARLEAACADWQDRAAHVCGPAPLLEVAEQLWSDAEVPDRLHLERFTLAPPSVPPSAEHAPTVASERRSNTAMAHFSLSGCSQPAPSDVPLLEVAELAGLSPASGCRMGICHTCTTRLEHGCTRDLRDGREHGPGAHVQLCVNAAVGDVALDL